MSRIQNGRILQKVDTKKNWESENSIILLENEIGFEKETGKYKIGDGIHFWKELPYAVSSENNDTNINISNGIGKNSIQQTLDAESWSSINTRMLEHLESVNYTTEDGAVAQKDASGNFLVGAFGKNSTMMNGKSQTVGGKTHAEGSKTLAFENNAHAEGNATYAGGKHSHAEGNGTAATANSAHAEGNGTIASGIGTHAEGEGTIAEGQASHAEGHGTNAIGKYAHSEGAGSRAEGLSSHAEGSSTIAFMENAHSEGSSTVAGNVNTHAEGHKTFAFGEQSHAEGNRTFAGIRGFNILGYAGLLNIFYIDSIDGLTIGDTVSIITDKTYYDIGTITDFNDAGFTLYNHNVVLTPTEGNTELPTNIIVDSSNKTIKDQFVNTLFVRTKPNLGTKVLGHHTHAEGAESIAMGNRSHSEGYQTKALGVDSHSEGTGTIATTESQHVQGRFNEIDNDNKYANIIGNGTSDKDRKNIHTIDWNGNAEFAGDIFVGPNKEKVLTTSTIPEITNFESLVENDSGAVLINKPNENENTIFAVGCQIDGVYSPLDIEILGGYGGREMDGLCVAVSPDAVELFESLDYVYVGSDKAKVPRSSFLLSTNPNDYFFAQSGKDISGWSQYWCYYQSEDFDAYSSTSDANSYSMCVEEPYTKNAIEVTSDSTVKVNGYRLISENDLSSLISRIEALEAALANIQNAEEVSF